MKLPHIIWLRPQLVSPTTVQDLRTLTYGPDPTIGPAEAFDALVHAGRVAAFVEQHLSGYFSLKQSGELTKIDSFDAATAAAAERNIWWAVLDRDPHMFRRLASVAHYHRLLAGETGVKKPGKKEIETFKRMKCGVAKTSLEEDLAALFIPVINRNTTGERSMRFISVDEIKLRL